MNRLLLSLLALAAIPAIHAAAPAEQTITFAVPEVDGRISLGVYDANKKLVRTLATGATDQDFKIGLNGLITTWDGKNDAGEPLPAGKYDVKGYVVSDKVKSEGEAFHFNDWYEGEDTRVVGKPSVVAVSNPFLVLRGTSLTLDPVRTRVIGFALEPTNLPFMEVRPRLGGSESETKPSNCPMMMGSGSGVAGVESDGKEVWVKAPLDAPRKAVPLGEEFIITSLSLGLGETFWIAGQPVIDGVPGPTLVRQYSFSGEVLRQIAGEPAGTTVSADMKENRIFLTNIEGDTSVIKGLRPLAPNSESIPAPTEAPKQANWEVFLEKTSTLCPKFGLVDGKLVADAGATEQKDGVRLELPPSTMDQKQHTLVVHVKAKDGELWATGSGGIRLALVGKLPGADRVVVVKGEKPGEIKVYAGNGVVVAEYLVSGLDEIAEINAGEIELP